MAATRIKTQDVLDAAITGPKLGIQSAKGDLIAHNGTTAVRLPVGTDGFILQSDSSNSAGVSWQSAATFIATHLVISETPAGTVNGTNPTFTLSVTPTAGTLQLYKNGIRQQVGGANDYTISTNTITFLAGNIPQTGDVLLADFQK